jgi:hypothetical protein
VSLFRPKLPENEPINPESSLRVRGLKGWPPSFLPALQDPFFAQPADMLFWKCGAFIGGVAGNNSKIGIQTPNDPTLRCIVDGAIVSSLTLTSFNITVVLGGAALAVVSSDSNVFVLNRAQQEASGAPSGCGLLRIQDNGIFVGGTGQFGQIDALASTALYLPIGLTLYASEQLMIQNNTANQVIRGMIWGRVTRGSSR